MDLVKFDFDDEFNLKIEVEPELRILMLSEFSKIYNKYVQFASWMNDPAVSKEDKKPYTGLLDKVNAEFEKVSWLLKLFGASNKDIEDYMNIPF